MNVMNILNAYLNLMPVTLLQSAIYAFAALGIMIALGALFPLLGLSMLVILALEFLVIRRVPCLARMFGTEPA